MQTKLIAGALAVALAAVSGSNDASPAEESARPTVVHVSVPLPARVERGHLSFASSVGGREWKVAATWGGRAKPHFTFVIVSAGL